nr:DNA methyltransferase [Ruegeria lacuscaerulensis]
MRIVSPKRDRRIQNGWEAFFPYYAGYPEVFVDELLSSADLRQSSVVLDPWNGSGTTTLAAARKGHRSIGYDINPVMIVIARARLLPKSEADSLEPILQQVLEGCEPQLEVPSNDPLNKWFHDETTAAIRALERSICERLVGRLTLNHSGVNLEYLSSIAAAFYVALFAVGRKLVSSFRSTNPTWIRVAKVDEDRVHVDGSNVRELFRDQIVAMTLELLHPSHNREIDFAAVELATVDSQNCNVEEEAIDLVVTSPPYCTRIDYTAATRVELAILKPLCSIDDRQLSRQMIGSTRVPVDEIEKKEEWGKTCLSFLDKVKAHPSKASSGYYLKTHLDYFEKMAASLKSIRQSLKIGGKAILVVQDSFYKDVHNDLPAILSEMAGPSNLHLKRREDFNVRRTMSGMNVSSKNYNRKPGAVEAVLCFEAV